MNTLNHICVCASLQHIIYVYTHTHKRICVCVFIRKHTCPWLELGEYVVLATKFHLYHSAIRGAATPEEDWNYS